MVVTDAAKPVRVLVVDDHPLVRDGLKLLVDSTTGVDVVGVATDGEEAIELNGRLEPDVVLMDLALPSLDGVEATRRILADRPSTRVLVLTAFGGDRMLFPALDAGAIGFLLKDSTGEQVVEAIRQVARGLSALSPAVARRLVGEVSHETQQDAPSVPLTPREIDILREMAGGLSNDQIADRLCISEATVRTHVTHVLSKLGLKRRTQAARYALKHGIATLDE